MRLAWMVTAVVLGMCAAASALAPGYPTKPVRVIVPFAKDGGVDLIARPVSQKLSELWGQPVTIENHPGAAGTSGVSVAATSAPDGYTLLVNSSLQVMYAALFTNLAYDTLKDFVPVAPLGGTPFVLVAGKPAGVNTLAELRAAVKAKPGQVKFSGGFAGTRGHLGAEKLNLEADLKAAHVPARGPTGFSEVLADTIAGRITYMLVAVAPGFLHPIREGRLVALAVTSARRSSLLPEIPTVAEAGLAGFDYMNWYGMWAPAGTPADIVDRIANDVARALAAPELRASLVKMGTEPMSIAPADFARFVVSESELTARIVKAAGIKPQ